MEIQRKLLKNSLLDVKTYFYFVREDEKEIFFKMLLKQIKKKSIRYSVLLIFLIKTWKFKENY